MVLAVAVSLLASACSVSGLSFVTDTRLTIVEPTESAEVALPFTVSWTVEDFDGRFAVFFDRSPLRPGQRLIDLVPDSDPCRREAVCPDAEWLADRNIYETDDVRIVIDRLPDLRKNNRSKDDHDMSIVLLDKSGRRSGEAVFTRELTVERED